jgi:predicted ATPase
VKVEITKNNKSIQGGFSFELPQFTILTGENGSGKTHLFEAINDVSSNKVHIDEKIVKNIRYIPFGGLNPQIDQNCDPNQISQHIKQIWNELNKAQVKFQNQAQLNVSHDPKTDRVMSQIRNDNYKNEIIRISNRCSVMPSNLTEDLISENVSMSNLTGNNLFASQFALIFKAYHVHYLDNLLNKVLAEDDYDVDNLSPFLEKEAFERKYGKAPWTFVNSILERLNLPYEVNNPLGTKRDSTFTLKLVNKITSVEIDTNALSTGEKTLMSLALAIYNTAEIGEQVKLLILDEVDAPLHPSMSKLMIEILQEEIVEKHGISVLMSTHSPTTIACAPAESLYKISLADKIPSQCSLEESIEILSYGIANLNVSIENRRQVFVEHSYDVEYLEALYTLLSRKYTIPLQLQFLPPHTQNGSNCSAVLEITRTLRNMGNKYVYGLVDWDRKNKPEKQVIILGLENRYAIENYIFEPHILALYLVYKTFISTEELSIQNVNSYLDLCMAIKQDESVLQDLSNYIMGKLYPNFQDNDLIESRLISGATIKIHKYYQSEQGHKLEDDCKNIWHKLRSVRSNNGGDSELKKDVLNTVIKDFPNYLSNDILETFKSFE